MLSSLALGSVALAVQVRVHSSLLYLVGVIIPVGQAGFHGGDIGELALERRQGDLEGDG